MDPTVQADVNAAGQTPAAAESTVESTAEPTAEPAAEPTAEPAAEPTAEPTAERLGGRVDRGGRRWWLLALLVAGYLAQVGWRLWLVRDYVAPTAHPDEDGYLVAARVFAGGAGGYSTENGLFRRVGYPLLLAPVYWLGDDAFGVYHRVQVLNAVVGSLLFPLAALFARRVLAVPARWALAAAFTVTALPAAVYYSGMAMTDAVLPTFAVAWLLAVHGWVGPASLRARRWYALGAGALAGAMYLIHVRGTMVFLVQLALAVVLLVSRRTTLRQASLATVAALAVAGLDPLLKAVLGDAIVPFGDNPSSQFLTAATVAWGIILVLIRAIGQLWYLGVGTLGVGAVGLLATAYPLLRRSELRRRLADPVESARLHTLLAALAATCLMALGSASSLPFGEHRVNYFAYPRYLHFLFPVWFLVGFAALGVRPWRARLKLTVAAGVAVAAGGLIVGWRTGLARGYYVAPFDMPELSALSWQWARFAVLVPTAVAVAVLAVVAVAQSRRRAAAVALAGVLALFLVGDHGIERHTVGPMVGYQYPPGVPRLVEDLGLGPGDVVAEAWQVPYPFLFNHMREVSWQRLLTFDANQPPPSEANVVIAPWSETGRMRSWDGSRFGLRQIAVDRIHDWAVWRRG